ncbi:excalibur calcium-binding domain-containing protein [Cereibacter sphaeroides]|uniref:excalibur calcium-binding domain-containing protein n=1 Tax=Cereibacter sphaeroides TaxID=1063 RepID=UPI0009D9BB87
MRSRLCLILLILPIGCGSPGENRASLYGAQTSATAAQYGDVDCSDFDSTASAQRFYRQAGGPAVDPHGLDRDRDGLACEWLDRQPSYPRYRSTSYGSSSYCHVGPRGGTYTITASGRKNYGGC